MKTLTFTIAMILSFICLPARLSQAQGTNGFTYQGRLAVGTNAVSGSYDLKFTIYDAATSGSLVAVPRTNFGVAMSEGTFSVELDFGSATFDGAARWLGIEVRTNGNGAFTPLTPRQRLLPTPYALHANTASVASTANSVVANAVTATGILPGEVVKSVNSLRDDVNFLAGANITMTVGGQAITLASPFDWHVTGNAGTSAGPNFLGTIDNQPFEIKVNNGRALRIEPGLAGNPNLIAGASDNIILNSVSASSIGGGSGNLVGSSAFAAVISGGVGNFLYSESHDSVIGGGRTNWAGGFGSTIAGGINNVIEDFTDHATIGGGAEARVGAAANWATIGGGRQNSISNSTQYASISGGFANHIGSASDYSSIGAGSMNTTIGTNAVIGGGVSNRVFSSSSTIAGGLQNLIRGGLFATFPGSINTIGGGGQNSIGDDDYYPATGNVIAGGSQNIVGERTAFNAISGGSRNAIGMQESYSAIGGGLRNFIDASYGTISGGTDNVINYASLQGDGNTIGGGMRNYVQTVGGAATISGGADNAITLSGGWSQIAGGRGNTVAPAFAAIGGGYSNTVSSGAQFALVAGGNNNFVGTDSDASSIGGGSSNLVMGTNSTIGGGSENRSYGDASSIAGGVLNAILSNDGFPSPRVGGYGATIGGGIQNTIKAGIGGGLGAFNTINGGSTNVINGGPDGKALGDTIGGGLGNFLAHRTATCTIAGGAGNFVADGASGSTIGGGSANHIDAIDGTIGGGAGNAIYCYLFNGQTISGGSGNTIGNGLSDCSYATIGGGQSNRIDSGGRFSVIPGGKAARTYNYGQSAFASGSFVNPGDAQASSYVCRNTTTNANQTELFLDGAFSRMTVPLNSTWSFEALVSARTSSGNSAGYRITGCIENNAGTTALIGSVVATALAEDVPAWDATIAADSANSALVVRVTGAAASTIRWVASIRTVEVTF